MGASSAWRGGRARSCPIAPSLVKGVEQVARWATDVRSRTRAVRTRNARQEMVYCLPPELGVPTTKSPLRQLVLDIEHNDVMIIIRTSPGAAQLIARLLDSVGKTEGVLGTIAGDDTIFIAPTSVKNINFTLKKVTELFEKV